MRLRGSRGLALFVAGYATYWTSMLLPGVAVKFMEGTSVTPGWVCALYCAPMWPVNGTLILLPLAWWRWRRSGARVWRIAGILGASSAAVAQTLVLVAPRMWDVEAIWVGMPVWLAASVAMGAAFAVTEMPRAGASAAQDERQPREEPIALE